MQVWLIWGQSRKILPHGYIGLSNILYDSLDIMDFSFSKVFLFRYPRLRQHRSLRCWIFWMCGYFRISCSMTHSTPLMLDILDLWIFGGAALPVLDSFCPSVRLSPLALNAYISAIFHRNGLKFGMMTL